MKKAAKSKTDEDIAAEYDFSNGVRGKYAQRYAEGTNVVVLSPDVAAFFPDSDTVNKALRGLVEIACSCGKQPSSIPAKANRKKKQMAEDKPLSARQSQAHAIDAAIMKLLPHGPVSIAAIEKETGLKTARIEDHVRWLAGVGKYASKDNPHYRVVKHAVLDKSGRVTKFIPRHYRVVT